MNSAYSNLSPFRPLCWLLCLVDSSTLCKVVTLRHRAGYAVISVALLYFRKNLELFIVQVIRGFFLLMVIVVKLLQKYLAFIAENSSFHENQDSVLVKEGIQAGVFGWMLKQAPVTVLSTVV